MFAPADQPYILARKIRIGRSEKMSEIFFVTVGAVRFLKNPCSDRTTYFEGLFRNANTTYSDARHQPQTDRHFIDDLSQFVLILLRTCNAHV